VGDDARHAGFPLAEAEMKWHLRLVNDGGRTEGGFAAAFLLAPGIVSGEEGADAVSGDAVEVRGQRLFSARVDQGYKVGDEWLTECPDGSDSGGRLGMAYAPMLIGERHDDNPAAADFRVRAFDTPTGVTSQRLQERRSVLQGFERHSPLRMTSEFAAQDLYQQRSFELLHGTAAKQAFAIDQEDASVRDRYGRNPLGQNLLLARRLIESGVRLVNVVAWTGLAAAEKFVSVETWDMHGNADVGFFEDGWNGLPFTLPRTDQAVATLLDDLRDRGLLDSTLVVLVGEFGRTPIIRKGGRRIGRDHWPQCYSAMLAGPGVRGGAVYGESDPHAAFVKSNPVTLENFTATLFAAMGINPASRLSPDGFTDPASIGEPIPQLLG
jgi:hypothetical protein